MTPESDRSRQMHTLSLLCLRTSKLSGQFLARAFMLRYRRPLASFNTCIIKHSTGLLHFVLMMRNVKGFFSETSRPQFMGDALTNTHHLPSIPYCDLTVVIRTSRTTKTTQMFHPLTKRPAFPFAASVKFLKVLPKMILPSKRTLCWRTIIAGGEVVRGDMRYIRVQMPTVHALGYTLWSLNQQRTLAWVK